MTEREFCYWLQGFIELSWKDGEINIDKRQAEMIADHLDLVFKKVTPDREPKQEEPTYLEHLTKPSLIQATYPVTDFNQPLC